MDVREREESKGKVPHAVERDAKMVGEEKDL